MIGSTVKFQKTTFLHNVEDAGSFCHCGSLATDGNNLYAAWYAYREEEHRDAKILLTRSNVEGDWQKTFPFDSSFTNSCGNPVLICSKPGHLHLLFVAIEGSYWSDAMIYISHSENAGLKWTRPKSLGLSRGMMLRHQPFEVKKGKWLLPAYDEMRKKTTLFESHGDFETWEPIYEFEKEMIQASAVHLSEQEWQLYFRPAGKSRFISCSYSDNQGKTWTTPRKTTLKCPLSGIAAATCKNNRIWVLHNHTTEQKRTPLNLSYSNDLGFEWVENIPIDEVSCELSYPSAVIDQHNTMHIIYTYNRRMMKYVALSLVDFGEMP